MVSASRTATWPGSQAASGGSHACPCWSTNIAVCPAVRCRRAVAVAPRIPSTRNPEDPDRQESVSAAAGGQPAGDLLDDRVDQAELRARRVMNLDVYLPAGAGQPAQQRPGRPGPQAMASLVATQRQRVGQHRGASRRDERRLQHHGLVHVRAVSLELTSGTDREVTGAMVQDAGKHGPRVEPREAQPVHRTGPAYQGCQRSPTAGHNRRSASFHQRLPSATAAAARAGAARLRPHRSGPRLGAADDEVVKIAATSSRADCSIPPACHGSKPLRISRWNFLATPVVVGHVEQDRGLRGRTAADSRDRPAWSKYAMARPPRPATTRSQPPRRIALPAGHARGCRARRW